jgi:hypothetical protein
MRETTCFALQVDRPASLLKVSKHLLLSSALEFHSGISSQCNATARDTAIVVQNSIICEDFGAFKMMKSNSSIAELRDIGLGNNGLVKFEFN